MGSLVTLTATINSATAGSISGTISFASGDINLGTANISNGMATLGGVQIIPSNGFVAGTTALVTANYNGDATFSPSFGSMTLTVAPLPATNTNLTVTPSSATVDSSVTLNAAVSSMTPGTINGTVAFQAGGTTLGVGALVNGTATLSNTVISPGNGFTVGSDTITARYSGDPISFAASSGTTTLTVTAVPTTTSLAALPPSIALNSTISLTAQVSSPDSNIAMGGTVTFMLGGRVLGTASANLRTATLSNVYLSVANGFVAGLSTITASYSGDSYFAASNFSTPITLTQQATMEIVTVTPAAVTMGSAIAVNAYITPYGATGTVTFAIGNTVLGTATVVNDNATLNNVTVSPGVFVPGENLIRTSYSGDSSSLPSSNYGGLDVYLPTTTTMTATPGSAQIGSTITLTATVSPSAATGTVYFSWGNTRVTATLVGGVAQATVVASQANGFTAGANTITANYAGLNVNGATMYWSSSATATVTLAVPTYTLTASPTSVSLSDGTSGTIAMALNSSGYAGTVSFATSVSPSAVSASAAAVTLTSGGSGSGTLIITASSNAANHVPNIPGKGGAILFCAALLGAPFTVVRKRRTGAVLFMALVILMAGSFMACGGAGGTTVKSARTYTVTVTPAGTGAVTNPLPVSVTVTVQ